MRIFLSYNALKLLIYFEDIRNLRFLLSSFKYLYKEVLYIEVSNIYMC